MLIQQVGERTAALVLVCAPGSVPGVVSMLHQVSPLEAAAATQMVQPDAAGQRVQLTIDPKLANWSVEQYPVV